jgi:hypothetical protein
MSSATRDRADADYQQEVREFVEEHVESNINSLIWEIKEQTDYFFQWKEEHFHNLFEERNGEQRHQDIYEWWTVSDYLYRKLKAKGAPVADLGSCRVWGRTTTGQAILLDGVICDIYDELNR